MNLQPSALRSGPRDSQAALVFANGQASQVNDFVLQRHFRLRQRPFVSCPCPDQYFAATSMENARASLIRLLERHEGPGLVVGPVGTGKSLLVRLLAESWRDRCHVVLLPGGRLGSRRSLLQVILYELGLPYRRLDEGELRLSLIDHVGNTELCPAGVMLLVDEADRLSISLLDELRSMTNLMADGKPSVRLVLFGSQRLEERFAHPRLESFNQRLAGRFYLEAFSQEETRRYVRQQFTECGGDTQVFSDKCLDTIHRATGGTPRLINQLCDHVLILAATAGQVELDAEHVEEAWADLQQLPAPARRSAVTAGGDTEEGIIEFGPLDATEQAEVDSAEQALSTLDELQEEVDFVQDEEAASDESFETTSSNETPQVELIFHPAHDPFTEEFAEEELVIDQYASADEMAQRIHRQVSCAESRKIAAQLEGVLRHLHLEPPTSNERLPAEILKLNPAEPADSDSSTAAASSDDGLRQLRHARPTHPTTDSTLSIDDPQTNPAAEPVEPLTDCNTPATNDPATNDPATNDPATNDPATNDPATNDPATDDPAQLTPHPQTVEEIRPSPPSGNRKRSDYSRLFSRLRQACASKQNAGHKPLDRWFPSHCLRMLADRGGPSIQRGRT